MSIHAVFTTLDRIPALTREVSLPQLNRFISLLSQLKTDIIVSQPPSHDPLQPPTIMAPHHRLFLSKVCGIELRFIDTCWTAVKDIIWQTEATSTRLNDTDFEACMLTIFTAGQSLWPPVYKCTQCPNPKTLRQHSSLCEVTLFTLRNGPRPTFAGHLSCPECSTQFYPNYYTFGGSRMYYEGIPDIIQVSKHHYIEKALAELLITQMVMAWTSATNGAQIYNQLFCSPTSSLAPEHVWDAFIVYSLIKDSISQGTLLIVPDGGEQKHRFDQAMSERSQRIATFGQDLINHYCDRCLKVTEKERGTFCKIHALVVDGICIGHPRCAFQAPTPCENPLSSVKHRFCSFHQDEEQICSIVSCRDFVEAGFLTCNHPDHRQLEINRNRRQKAMFQLKNVLAWQGIAQPSNLQELEDIPDDIEHSDGPYAPGPSTTFSEDSKDCPDKDNNDTKLKGIFGRLRTHAELVFHRPCGIMVRRVSCLRAESLTQVSNELQWFKTINMLPEVIFYDNNCRLYRYLKAHNNPIAEESGLPVDVFHWKSKHKRTDVECAVHCNPYRFPELREDAEDVEGKWSFNSSVAEQNNVWLGGFLSIVREMGSVKYNFFLDEMIQLKNEMTLSKLHKYNADII
ncbi:hypothetical protein F5051DRAFT_341442 [Lentinula edodes]|nr:hypothetical protein F5051DRAFT_341442 [Lentinula edodes]